MLDSGAQPSVMDTKPLEELRLPFQVRPSQVHGVGDTSVPTRGLDCGNGIALYHRFVVLDSIEHTIILGRDFLKRFRSTEFDWMNRRVRLGSHWLQTEACLWGGHVLSRAGAVWNVLQEGGVENGREGALTDEWNVNPSLDRHQRTAMTKLLEEYSEVFARNPKKPKQTFFMEHVINTGNALPVKSRYIRVCPRTEGQMRVQINLMLENEIIRPSTSPWASRIILVQKNTAHSGLQSTIEH